MESSWTCKGVVKGHGGHGAPVRGPGIGEPGPVGFGDLVAEGHAEAPARMELLEFGGMVHRTLGAALSSTGAPAGEAFTALSTKLLRREESMALSPKTVGQRTSQVTVG